MSNNPASWTTLLSQQAVAKRKVFYSFHYQPDHWRASQVRNMGVVEGNQVATDNDWETVKRGGDDAIKRWINAQLAGRSCCVVLIGTGTANRRWINYEIIESWNAKKGVLGIHIHKLKDSLGVTAAKGPNPFDFISMQRNNAPMSTIVPAYDPPYFQSTDIYAYIKNNLSAWIEAAIKTREKY